MKKFFALGACLAVSLSMSACGGSNDSADPAQSQSPSATAEQQASTEATPDLTSLSSWKGEWNNIDRYLDDPALEPGFKAAAEKNKTTVEKEKSDLHTRRAADFGGMTIEGNRITFLDDFASKGGKEVASEEYTFDKTYESVVGGRTRTWYAFRTSDESARYPTMMFFPIDPKEDLLHFHFRYGKTPEELLAKDGWFPTVVSPATTNQQLIAEISE